MLGITVRQVARRVHAGTLVPAVKLPGLRGAYLFDPDRLAPEGSRK